MYNILIVLFYLEMKRKCSVMVMTVYVMVLIQDFADDTTKYGPIFSNIKGQDIFILFYDKYPIN